MKMGEARMRRSLAWAYKFAVAAIVLVLLVVGCRWCMVVFLQRMMFVTHSSAKVTPADTGTAYTRVKIASGDHVLEAWQVSAGPNTPALLIFHGNSATVHDWAEVQVYLARHGLSSMVFDYAGFGGSSGKPTLDNLNQDAVAAYGSFVRWIGPTRPKFVLAHSLGTAVLLNNVGRFAPTPAAAITYGTFTSVHDLVLYLGAPSWWGYFIPDVWDSVGAVQRLRHLPLLVLAGADDSNVSPEMGRRVAIAADAQFKLIWDADHEDIHNAKKMQKVWRPILAFVAERLADQHWQGPAPSPEDYAPTAN